MVPHPVGGGHAPIPALRRVLQGEPDIRMPSLPQDEDFAPGGIVGPYRLKARIGHGGMGEVWRARRLDGGPERDVALKLPYRDLLGGPFRKRFARERDTLAALIHPNIAQLYDAGTSPDGHPYLALELLDGMTVTVWSRARALPLDGRIGLLQQILAGLDAAHRRLIVHRDIKPANVLVTPDGTVKLLDFGIGKLLRPDAGEDLTLTQPKAALATPAYAAPEQLDGGAITVATDLYAVGVLLFELCTGQLPFARAPLEKDAAPAPLASQRLDEAAAGLPDRRPRARLRGDLDAIIAKGVALEPAARYASADAFAEDLRRWRTNVPVRARRIAWPLRVRKFVQRNRLGVSLSAVLAVAVAGGMGGILWQMHRTDQQAARAVAMKDFFIGLFRHSSGNFKNSTGGMSAAELLELASQRADQAFAGDPETEIELLGELGETDQVQLQLGLAEGVYERRLALSRKVFGPRDPRTLDTALDLAWDTAEWGHPERTLPLLDSIRGDVLVRDGGQSARYAQWLLTRSQAETALPGGPPAALADAAASVAIFARYFPNDDRYFDALTVLFQSQYYMEQFGAALATQQRILDIDATRHWLRRSARLGMAVQTGAVLQAAGRLGEAEASFRRAKALADEDAAHSPRGQVLALNYLAQLADLRGDRDTADRLYGEGLALSRDKRPFANPPAMTSYGVALAREGRAAEALPYLKVLNTPCATSCSRNRIDGAEAALGDAYDQLGQAREARTLLQAARDDWQRDAPAAGISALNARARWARFLFEHGDTPGARAEFRAVQANATPTMPAAALATAGLARIALAEGDLAQADAQSALALKNLDAITVGHDVRIGIDIWLARAAVLRAGKRPAEAQVFARQAAEAARAWDAPGSGQRALAEAGQ